MLPILAGVVVALMYVASFLQELSNHQIWATPRVIIGVMFTGISVPWALAGGFASTDAVLLMRRRNVSLLEGLPVRARCKLLVTRMGLICSGLAVATLVTCGVATLVGMAHGGRLSWSSLELVPMAVIGLLAFAGVGYAVAIWWPSWFVPPLVTIGGYVAGNINSLRFLQTYGGAYPPMSAVQHPVVSLYVGLAGFFALISLCAATWLLARWSLLWRVVASILFVASVVGGVAVDRSLSSAPSWWVNDSRRAWPCYSLAQEQSVCVPADRPGDVVLVRQQLAALAPRVVQLDPTFRNINWIPGISGRGELGYILPLGQSISGWRQASNAVSGMSWACLSRYILGDRPIPVGLQEDPEIVTAWVAGNSFQPADPTEMLDISLPVSLSQAQAAYGRMVRCDY